MYSTPNASSVWTIVWLKKRPIHTGFDAHAGQRLLNLLDAMADELFGAIGIMHITGAVEHCEYLASLGDSTEEGIIAALSLFLAVEADGGTFGKAARADDRAVEVQRDGAQVERHQSLQYHLPQQAL